MCCVGEAIELKFQICCWAQFNLNIEILKAYKRESKWKPFFVCLLTTRERIKSQPRCNDGQKTEKEMEKSNND